MVMRIGWLSYVLGSTPSSTNVFIIRSSSR
jgi:hypothetical protein